MADVVSTQLKALLAQMREAASIAPGGQEAQHLRDLGPWLQRNAAGLPCLGCPHAVIILDDMGPAVGACKKFVALPRRDEERAGFKLMQMHCTAALEPAEGAGTWDDLEQHQLATGAGEAERDQQRPQQERDRG